MNKIKPLAMLITGGLATQANATVQYFNVGSSTEGTEITIGGAAAPQYIYQSTLKPISGTPQYEFQTASTTSYLTNLNVLNPAPNAGSTFYQGSYKVGPIGDQVGLKFNIGNQTFFGVASFAPGIPDALTEIGSSTANVEDPFSPRLGQIEYQLASVPEPESWAMLIAGMGVAGIAVRRSRRRPALVTA